MHTEIQLSQLGDANAEANRVQQGFVFDQLDPTGVIPPAGKKLSFKVYVDAERPEKIRLFHRAIGSTDGGDYTAAGGTTINQPLKNGLNKITVNLEGYQCSRMLFARNISKFKAKIRIEAEDANQVNTSDHVHLGTQLRYHPYYIYDAQHPEKFYDFMEELHQFVENKVKKEEEYYTTNPIDKVNKWTSNKWNMVFFN